MKSQLWGKFSPLGENISFCHSAACRMWILIQGSSFYKLQDVYSNSAYKNNLQHNACIHMASYSNVHCLHGLCNQIYCETFCHNINMCDPRTRCNHQPQTRHPVWNTAHSATDLRKGWTRKIYIRMKCGLPGLASTSP